MTNASSDAVMDKMSLTKNEDGELILAEYHGDHGSLHVIKNSADFKGELDFSILIKCKDSGKSFSYFTATEEMYAFMLAISQFFDTDELTDRGKDEDKNNKLINGE